jgi:hypothetical protein
MDRYRGAQSALTISLHGGLYLTYTMDRYGGPDAFLTIALLGGF